MDLLIKYKHYLAILAALLLVEWLVIPLYDNQYALQQKAKASEKRIAKIEQLISKKDALLITQFKLDKDLAKATPLIFEASDEASFKITAQSGIESALKSASCSLEQIGWEGSSPINDKITRWQLKARYVGDANCLLIATRNLEKMQPIVRIDSYFYGGKAIEKKPNSKVTANVDLVMWQFSSEAVQ
jgi:hypothetical protein